MRRKKSSGFKRSPRRDSKGGHILYLMVFVPFICFWKIGITGVSAISRAKSVDRAVFGFPVPVFIVFIPGAYHFEQTLHNLLSPVKADFYDGDGHSECVWFVAVPFALAFMLSVWGIYFLLIDLALGTHLLPRFGDLLAYLCRFFLWFVRKVFS